MNRILRALSSPVRNESRDRYEQNRNQDAYDALNDRDGTGEGTTAEQRRRIERNAGESQKNFDSQLRTLMSDVLGDTSQQTYRDFAMKHGINSDKDKWKAIEILEDMKRDPNKVW